jgi:hypothetical protein
VLARTGRIVGLPESKRHLLGINSDGKTRPASSIRETGQDTGEIVQREDVEDMGKIIEMDVDGDKGGTSGRREDRSPSKRWISKEADRSIDLDSIGLEKNERVAQESGTQQEVQSIQPVTKPVTKPKGKGKKNKKRNVIDDLFGHLV